MNLAYQDIRHSMGRFLLTCVGLSLLLGVVLSMIGIYRGMVADAVILSQSSMADIWVVEENTRGPFAEASRLPGDIRESVARLQGVEKAGSITYQSIETTHQGNKLRLYITGYELTRLGGPDKIVEGRGLSRSHYEMVVDYSSKLSIGERVKLGRNIFTVVGMVNEKVSSSGDPVVYITLSDSQELQFELTPSAARREIARGNPQDGSDIDTVNAVIARLKPNTNSATVIDTIERWKHLSAMTQQDQENILIMSIVEKNRKQIGMFTVLLLIVSAVIIALIIYTMTMDKKKEIATLKLIGAPNSTIIGLIIQQALAMGIIGFGLGAILIVTVKDYFPRRVILQPDDTFFLALIVIFVCIIASMLGVRLALKIDPATALGG